jgi:hypothetical protein
MIRIAIGAGLTVLLLGSVHGAALAQTQQTLECDGADCSKSQHRETLQCDFNCQHSKDRENVLTPSERNEAKQSYCATHPSSPECQSQLNK